MVAAAERVTHHEVGVVALQIRGTQHSSSNHLGADARCVLLENLHHVVGVSLRGFVPRLSVGQLQRQDTHLHPQHVLAFGCTRGIRHRGLPHDKRGRRWQLTGRGIGVGPRHVVDIRTDVHIVIGACLCRDPRREVIHGQVDHHRGVAGPELSGACDLRTRGDGVGQQVGHQRRVDVGDHRTRRIDHASVGKAHPGGRITRNKDLGHARLTPHGSTRRLDDADKCIHHRACTALTDDHAKHLSAHGFQEREQRTTGNVRRKVQVHAP